MKKIFPLYRVNYSFPKLFYKLLIINLLLDIFSFWSQPGGVTAVLRITLLYGSIAFLLVLRKASFNINKPIIIFSLYVLGQLIFAQDVAYSLKVSLQIITSLMMFFVGYGIIQNENDFIGYIKQFYWIYILIIVNTILSNYFKVGSDNYTESADYMVGGLSDLWNVYTYSLIMLPLLIHYKIRSKYILYFVSIIVLILLILSLKRIAIGGVVFAIIGFLFFFKKKMKVFKYLLFFIPIVISLSPFYADTLEGRIEARADKGRFESNFYETEARYMELLMMEDWITNFKEPLSILFGLKAFDTRGALHGGERQFHVDYTLILYSIGVIGLILYFSIYFALFRKANKYFKKIKKSEMLMDEYKIHIISVLVLLLTSLLTSLAGQMYHITFRMMIFMTIGAIFRLVAIRLNNRPDQIQLES
ncbi:hypothetical protein [Salegentibacter sp. UBA1130]|uniref:hypothetical protein n=1 Tax=Salegentibacter sp. UBA1130 TaxID=1947451 RepID=UPI00257A0BEC|nr:hypothetical protein [Salegentibacter sp. UBA1130]